MWYVSIFFSSSAPGDHTLEEQEEGYSMCGNVCLHIYTWVKMPLYFLSVSEPGSEDDPVGHWTCPATCYCGSVLLSVSCQLKMHGLALISLWMLQFAEKSTCEDSQALLYHEIFLWWWAVISAQGFLFCFWLNSSCQTVMEWRRSLY